MLEITSRPFANFLKRSLVLLASETPEHFEAVRRDLEGLAVCIRVGAEAPVRVQLDVEPWVGPPAHAEVTAWIAQRDLVSVLKGRLTLEQALAEDRLDLRGQLDHLLRFLDALGAWVHGAVRCGPMARLYDQYITRTETPGGSDVPQTATLTGASART